MIYLLRDCHCPCHSLPSVTQSCIGGFHTPERSWSQWHFMQHKINSGIHSHKSSQTSAMTTFAIRCYISQSCCLPLYFGLHTTSSLTAVNWRIFSSNWNTSVSITVSLRYQSIILLSSPRISCKRKLALHSLVLFFLDQRDNFYFELFFNI